MIHSVIDKKNKQFYTFLSDVFRDLGNAQPNYNWLVIPRECYPRTPEFEEMFSQPYAFLSGAELTSIVEKEDFQWIWAVFCLFEKDVSLSEILEHPIDFGREYWPDTDSEPAMLHPLSVAEIYACDSCCTVLLSRDKKRADDFHNNVHPQNPATA